MRIVALLFIVFILASLASALYYLIKDKGQSDRTVKMLTVRVALSLILFLLLMGGYYFGVIRKAGCADPMPRQKAASQAFYSIREPLPGPLAPALRMIQIIQ